MNKITSLLLISIFLIFISCDDNQQTSVSETDRLELVPEPDKELREEQEDYLKEQKVIKTVGCSEFSEEMKAFIELLKEDNYSIKEDEGKYEISFESYEDISHVETQISFSKDGYKSIFAKRKNKLKDKKDNWYPSFLVSEICFENEEIASRKYQEISGIINNFDLHNDKNYDYILKNGSKLIYVSCGAKIFEEYAMSYKDKVEGIIKVNRGIVDELQLEEK